MGYFECIVGNGGGQTDIPLIVTCDAAFAGLTITASQTGQTSLTQTCPSTSPYQVVFHLPTDGTWTISGTISGQTYSESITISAYEISLFAGIDWQAWVDASVDLDSTDYADLDEVLADEKAVRELMLVHACVDILADVSSANADVVKIINNDICAKWINLSDYALDTLKANASIAAAMATADKYGYGEWVITDDTTTPKTWGPKGNVPVMTSNSAPYGTASGTNIYSGDYYKAFDNDDTTYAGFPSGTSRLVYKFANPINPKRIVVWNNQSSASDVSSYKVIASNDGSTFDTIDTFSEGIATKRIHNLETDNYYLYVGIEITASSMGAYVSTLQFYGRELSVSVPVMTSNTAPFGEASGDGVTRPWGAFQYSDINNGANVAQGQRVVYDFKRKVKCLGYRKPKVSLGIASATYTYKMQGSNDGTTWVDLISNDTVANYVDGPYTDFSQNIDEYRYYGMLCVAAQSGSGYVQLAFGVNFYGLDYSEKEFEQNSGKKWLYDHGVELETFTAWESGTVAREDSQIGYSKNTGVNGGLTLTSALDLTPWDLLRAKVGDDITIANTEFAVTGFTPYRIITTDDMPNNAYLDIATVDESKNIIICANAQASSGKFTMAEMWLEP